LLFLLSQKQEIADILRACSVKDQSQCLYDMHVSMQHTFTTLSPPLSPCSSCSHRCQGLHGPNYVWHIM